MGDNMKYIMQSHYYDCGVACVCSVLKHYRIHYDEVIIRDLCKSGNKGISGIGILKALEAYLIDVKAYKASSLSAINSFPGIALIENEVGNHYIMITSIKNNIITYHDPLKGLVKQKIEVFQKKFLGIYFTCKPTFKVGEVKSGQKFNFKINSFDILVVVLLAVMVFISSFIANYQVKFLFDSKELSIAFSIMIILIFETIKITFLYYKNKFVINTTRKYQNSLSKKFISSFLKLDYSYFYRRSSADFDLIYNDSRSISELFELKANLGFYILMQVFYLVLISVFSLPFSLWLLLYSVFVSCFLLKLAKEVRRLQTTLLISNLQIKNSFLGLVKGFQEIRVNNMIETVSAEFDDLSKQRNQTEYLSQRRLIRFASLLNLILLGNYLISLFLLFNLLEFKTITSGELVVLLTMFISFNQTFNIYPLIIFKIQNLRLSKARNTNLSLYSSNDLKRLENDLEVIEFKNVSYSYDYLNTVIKDLSFKLTIGNLFIFTGENGVGKSTLTKLILGFLTPDDGYITYNNKSKLKKISLISDNSLLFNYSVLSNIVLRKEQDQKKIDIIQKKLGISDSLLKLQITNYGNNLSSGQKQLILLARSIYQQDKCIILDEPFNYLAIELKMQIMKYLRKLSKDKLIILVTHDRSIINNDDKIINLKENDYERINF